MNLLEWLEDGVLRFLGDADACIGYLNRPMTLIRAHDIQAYSSFLCELDRVADQIDHNLADAAFVTKNCLRQVRIDIRGKFQPLLLRQNIHARGGVLEELERRE